MLENFAFFSNKKVKNHPSINIESGGRGELACCPKIVVDTRKTGSCVVASPENAWAAGRERFSRQFRAPSTSFEDKRKDLI